MCTRSSILTIALAVADRLARCGLLVGLIMAGAWGIVHAQPAENACRAPESGYVGREDRNLQSVIVFVHGLGGSATGTWMHSPLLLGDDVFWPCLLRQDPEFAESNVYVYQYGSQIAQETATIDMTASNLYRDLKADRVFEHTHITFVAHSLGGLVVSRMLLQLSEQEHPGLARVRQVMFYGVPGAGADLAGLAKYLGPSRQVDELADQQSLASLARRWKATAWSFSWSCLAEGQDTGPLWPLKFRVVPQQSAWALCGGTRSATDVLAGLDHLTIVKPTSTSAAPHRRFYTDYALCVRPFVRNLSGIDIGATEPGRRLLAWYSELRDRMEQDGSDGLDRIAWLSERLLFTTPGALTDRYVLPARGEAGLDGSSYEVVNSRNTFALQFFAQVPPRIPTRSTAALVVPIGRLHELVADRSAITMRSDLQSQLVLATDDVVLILGGDTHQADRVALFVGSEPGTSNPKLKGFLILPQQDECHRPKPTAVGATAPPR